MTIHKIIMKFVTFFEDESTCRLIKFQEIQKYKQIDMSNHKLYTI